MKNNFIKILLFIFMEIINNEFIKFNIIHGSQIQGFVTSLQELPTLSPGFATAFQGSTIVTVIVFLIRGSSILNNFKDNRPSFFAYNLIQQFSIGYPLYSPSFSLIGLR